ncbi:MAG TPA: translesion DNA synthesis-associated protein ImuA [Burkholderiaceae bacterium]|nr:translesion DNA synthesis-associated protein ImuA [Burkholderiaceae bacterium]
MKTGAIHPTAHPPAHPERIHPALWRAASLHAPRQDTVPTGFARLDHELPGLGWPLGSLVELVCDQPGIGEINLLRPALTRLAQRRIALVRPPGEPCTHCCTNWRLDWRRLLWITPRSANDALWAAEQILRHDSQAILLCWVDRTPSSALRRLHLAARGGTALFFLLRPETALRQPSVAPLRLRLRPAMQGLEISIIKRQGPLCDHPVSIPLHPHAHDADHAPLDLPALAGTQPGRVHPGLAG